MASGQNHPELRGLPKSPDGEWSAADRVAFYRYRYELLRRLRAQRDAVLQAELYSQLGHFSNLLALPVPPLDEVAPAPRGRADSAALLPFWKALKQLEQQGVAFNHACDPNLLAVNLPELKELAPALSRIAGLPRLLRACHTPPFKEYGAVHSRLTGKPKKCWVFSVVVAPA